MPRPALLVRLAAVVVVLDLMSAFFFSAEDGKASLPSCPGVFTHGHPPVQLVPRPQLRGRLAVVVAAHLRRLGVVLITVLAPVILLVLRVVSGNTYAERHRQLLAEEGVQHRRRLAEEEEVRHLQRLVEEGRVLLRAVVEARPLCSSLRRRQGEAGVGRLLEEVAGLQPEAVVVRRKRRQEVCSKSVMFIPGPRTAKAVDGDALTVAERPRHQEVLFVLVDYFHWLI